MKQRTKKLMAVMLSVTMSASMLPAQAIVAAPTSGVTFTEAQDIQVSHYGEERSTLFNDGWKFSLGRSSSAYRPEFNDADWENVTLPHDFSIFQNFTPSGEAESGFLPGGTGWYRKSFTLPESCAGKRMVLNFDGVYSHAAVYVNGTKVGEHHYGYTAFAFDITDYVKCDGSSENVIAVEAVNNIPSSRWYSGSGIYRDVTLLVTDPVHVALNGTFVTTPNLKDSSGTDGTVKVAVDVQNDSTASANVTVRNTVYEKDGTTAVATDSATASVEAGATVTVDTMPIVSSPKLWSIDEPNLYYVRTEILQGSEVVDTYDTEFGFKWYEFVDNVGFKLNGENVKINGVCMHHDQGALGSAAYRDAIYRQLSILKDMGTNTIRITHNPGAEVYVDVCNELGLLVIEEMFDGWNLPKNGNSNDFSTHFDQNLTADNQIIDGDPSMTWAEFVMKATIKRDRNDASIILWSLGNEIQEGTGGWNDWGGHARNLIKWAAEVDTTHPLTSGANNRSVSDDDSNSAVVNKLIYENGGVAGFNYGNMSGMNSLHQTYPVFLYSETASATTSRGIYVSQANNSNADGKMHLTSYDTSSVGWGKTAHASMWDTMTTDWLAGECVWTGFDYIGEPTPWNGTGTGDGGRGSVPNSSYFGIVETTGFAKDNYYLYRSQWNKDANTLHLVTAWDSDNMMTSNGKTPVWVYSNAARVDLYRNGTKIGTATRNVNTTPAGHVYYTYTTQSENNSVCTTSSGSGSTSLYSVFNVAYEAGTISARAYDESGTEITNTCKGNRTVSTPGTVNKLVVKEKTEEILADGSSLAYIAVDVTDANGNLDTTADNDITFTLEGNGEIMGVDNGDQATTEKYQQSSVLTSKTSAHIKAFSGKALVIVRSTTKAGTITVDISSNGLTGETVVINSKQVEGTAENGIESYRMSKHCYAPIGTASLTLPATLPVTFADGTTGNLGVTWESYNRANLQKSGLFQVKGTLTNGAEKIAVAMTVHVYGEIVGAKNYSTITAPNVMPSLPVALMTYYADGTAFEESPVTWDLAGITAASFANIGDIKEIKGTVTALGKTYPVTASVRVAEPIYGDKQNIAPAASDLSSNATGDTLTAINNGIKYASSDGTSQRWSNWPERNGSEAATITMAWDTAHLVDQVNLYYYLEDHAASQAPTSVAFEYSLDGSTFTPVGHGDPTALPSEAGKAENGYSFQLDEAINPIAFRIVLGHDAGKFIGLTEVEIMETTISYEENTSADLDGILVGGKAIAGFQPNVTEYTVDSLENITVVNSNNASVTILSDPGVKATILSVSEDGKTTKTYTLIKAVSAAEKADASAKLAAAKKIDGSLYTPESYAKLQSAIAALEKNLNSANSKELAAYVNALVNAQNALVKKTTTTQPPRDSKVGNGRYQVVSESKKTAKLVSVINKKATKMNVPATVKIGGQTYKVVEVGSNAMKGASKLKKVTLGSNVTTIGKQAFMNCKNLKSVLLKGKALKTIKSGAFKKTSSKLVVSAKKMNKKEKAKLLKKLKKAGAGKKVKVK